MSAQAPPRRREPDRYERLRRGDDEEARQLSFGIACALAALAIFAWWIIAPVLLTILAGLALYHLVRWVALAVGPQRGIAALRNREADG